MQVIQTVTSDPLQIQYFTLPDGSQVQMTFYYRPRQFGWFLNTLVYGTFTLNGLRICNSPNLLRQWQNIIPFGLSCLTQNLREPTQQQDFASGAAKLYLLTSEEVETYEELLSSGI